MGHDENLFMQKPGAITRRAALTVPLPADALAVYAFGGWQAMNAYLYANAPFQGPRTRHCPSCEALGAIPVAKEMRTGMSFWMRCRWCVGSGVVNFIDVFVNNRPRGRSAAKKVK